MILRKKKAREENHDWDQNICLFNFSYKLKIHIQNRFTDKNFGNLGRCESNFQAINLHFVKSF